MNKASNTNDALPEIILVAGARPNFIKVAPVMAALREREPRFAFRLVHTGQHYDEQMSEVFFRELGIPVPDVHLEVGPGSHAAQTARILERFEQCLLGLKRTPAAVMVVGDVNSTVACGLAAAKLDIGVVHLEAGLRSFDRAMPEEINRLVTDALAGLLLVSEPAGEENLRREGVADGRIRYVGNVMIDTLMRELGAAQSLEYSSTLGLRSREYAVVTLHRPSNVDDAAQLECLMAFLMQVSGRLKIVFPVHPRTRNRLEQAGWLARLSGNSAFRILPPLSYRENLSLLAGARLVLTDSGGIQEETSSLGVPCLTLRKNTERPVTVSEGTNTLVGQDLNLAMDLVGDILAGTYKQGTAIRGWDGRASERVLDALEEMLGSA